jgi:hypothetical protein
MEERRKRGGRREGGRGNEGEKEEWGEERVVGEERTWGQYLEGDGGEQSWVGIDLSRDERHI